MWIWLSRSSAFRVFTKNDTLVKGAPSSFWTATGTQSDQFGGLWEDLGEKVVKIRICVSSRPNLLRDHDGEPGGTSKGVKVEVKVF